MNHFVTRFEISSSTYDNAKNFIELISSERAKAVYLYALPTSEEEDPFYLDPGENNLPAMVALVEFEIPSAGQVSIIVDGLFLTAVRGARFEEVAWVLDEAQKLDTVFWGHERAPFTARLAPEEAYKKMMKIPFSKFTEESRPDYFKLLSTLTEKQIWNL